MFVLKSAIKPHHSLLLNNCAILLGIVLVLIIMTSVSVICSSNNPNHIPNQQEKTSSNQQEEPTTKDNFWSLSLKNKLLKYANTVQSGFQKVLSSSLVEKIKGKSKKLSEHSKNLLKTLKNKSKQALHRSKDIVKEQFTKLKQSTPAQKIKKLSKKALRKLLDHLDLIPPSEKNSHPNDEEEEDRVITVLK